MKIIHTISSIDISGGGPSKSVSDLATNQALQGVETLIITNASKSPYLEKSPHKNLQLQFTEKKAFKKQLDNTLIKNQFDLLHGHGMWQMPVHHMARLAQRKSIPYIITPRGMLEPWALNAGKWKKKLALQLYQRKDLALAACIHATAEMEAENIRKLGFKNPIAVIPNGIDLEEFPTLNEKLEKEKNTILFLSRIHPKKGIELLIEAWGKLERELRQNWKIEIAGNGEQNYIKALQQLINKKELQNEIQIIGPQFGDAKLAAYHRADLFVLPTYSENFGIVVAEALACEVPVITTKGTPWEELNTHNAGWWIDIGVEPLVATLKEALQLNESDRQKMGKNGRKLVQKNYSIESVASKMIELYKWVLQKREKPEFILD